MTADGGVPVFARAYDGGAGEVGQVVGAMQALQELAGPTRMLIVGDSKLVSYTNLATMIDQKVAFIAPASKTYVPAAVLAAQDLGQADEVDYVAARDAGKPADRRGRWHVRQDTMTLAGPRKKDPVLRLRRVFVHSSARAGAAAVARAKKLDRASDDLARLGAARSAKPTANLIFKALRPLRLIPASNGNPPVIPQPSPLQLRLLNLLAIDPRRPRDG